MLNYIHVPIHTFHGHGSGSSADPFILFWTIVITINIVLIIFMAVQTIRYFAENIKYQSWAKYVFDDGDSLLSIFSIIFNCIFLVIILGYNVFKWLS